MKNVLEYWGPRQTRQGRFTGLTRPWDADDGETTRLIARSDAHMMGPIRANLRHFSLYRGLGQMLARFADAFGPALSRIGFAIRPCDAFWAWSLAYAIPHGHAAPDAGGLGWLIGRPAQQFCLLTNGRHGLRLPRSVTHANTSVGRADLRLVLLDRGNLHAAEAIRAGKGRFMSFDRDQRAAMQEAYAAYLAWLRLVSGKTMNFDDGAEVARPFGREVLKRGLG